MWSRTKQPDTGVWVPNHFVPLVHQSDTEDLNSTLDSTAHTHQESALVSDVSLASSRPSDVFEMGNIDTPLRGELQSSSFLDNTECLRLLALDLNGLADIPDGLKENVYFVLNNADNVARRKASARSVFWDDCGVWSSEGTGTPPFYYLLCEDGPPAYIRCVKGVFGKRVKGSFEALTPQPKPEQVLVVRRSYSKLKRDPTYRRRVTWLDHMTRNWSKPLAIVEYCGKYPQHSASHGNSVKETEYVRTKPAVVAAVDVELKSRK